MDGLLLHISRLFAFLLFLHFYLLRLDLKSLKLLTRPFTRAMFMIEQFCMLVHALSLAIGRRERIRKQTCFGVVFEHRLTILNIAAVSLLTPLPIRLDNSLLVVLVSGADHRRIGFRELLLC